MARTKLAAQAGLSRILITHSWHRMAIDAIMRDLIVHLPGYTAGQIDPGPDVYDYHANKRSALEVLRHLAEVAGGFLDVSGGGVISMTVSQAARNSWPRSPFGFPDPAAAGVTPLYRAELDMLGALTHARANPEPAAAALADILPPDLLGDALAALGLGKQETDATPAPTDDQ